MEPKGRCSTPTGSTIGFPNLPLLERPTRLRNGPGPSAQIPRNPGQRQTTTRPALSAWESESQRLGLGKQRLQTKPSGARLVIPRARVTQPGT